MVRTNVMTVIRWYAQDEANQEESEHNEVDGMKKGVDSTGAYLKERLPLAICNDEDTDRRARLTTDEERVLPEDY